MLLRHDQPNRAAEEAAYTGAYNDYQSRFNAAQFKPEMACMELLEYVGLVSAAIWWESVDDLADAAAHVIVHTAWMRLMLTRQEAKK